MKKTRDIIQYRELIRAATDVGGRLYSAIVLICGFVFALSLCFILRPHFEFDGNLDIVSWITVNKYPKQQEIFYYAASLFFVPFFATVVWGSWLLCSRMISDFTKLPLQKTLKKYAFAYLPFILILKNIQTPTFTKTLLIPIILVVSAKIAFFIHDLLQTRLKEFRSALFYRGASDLHWSVFTSGFYLGFFVLISYSKGPMNISSCLETILAISSLVWMFWLSYSWILSAVSSRSFRDAFAHEVYSNFPLAILLLTSWFFSHRNVVLVLCLASVILVKTLIIIKPRWSSKLSSTHLHRYILEYAIIPALIYVFFYSAGNIHGGIDMFHEGERLAPLNALWRGKIPYRDIYLQHGLFHNAYRPLLAAKLFGPTLAADRMLGHILDPLRYIAFYILGLQIFRSRLFALLSIWVIASGKTYDLSRRAISTRHALGIISIAMLSSYMLSHRRSATQGRFHLRIILAGIFAALNVFYSVEMGLYTLAAGGLFLLLFSTAPREKIRDRFFPLLSYVIGAFIAFLPFVLYFSFHGAIDDLFRNFFAQCRYHIPIWGLRFPPLFAELSKIESLQSLKAFVLSGTFKWYFPILIYLITLTYLVFQRFKGQFWKPVSNAILLLLVITGIMFFRTPLGRSDGWHLYGISFAWLICIFLIESLSTRMWKDLLNPDLLPAAVWRLILVLTFAWFFLSSYNLVGTIRDRLVTMTGYRNIERDVEPSLERAGGIKLPAEQASQIKAVVDYIRNNTTPDETIFDFSSQGAYYFFADRPMASKYHQVCYAATEAMQKEVIADLERHKTKLVIFTTGSGFDRIDGVPSVERHPLIAEYLKEKYPESVKIGKVTIVKRRQ